MEYLLYAECALILAALLTAGIGGVTILQRRPDATGRLMGWAALVLGIGEALSLIPRALWLLGFREQGLGDQAGRMAAAIAVSVFCILLSLLWEKVYEKKNGFFAETHIRELSGARALACLLPVFLWLGRSMHGEMGDPLADEPIQVLAGIAGVRGVTLLIVAAVVARHWYVTRAEVPTLRNVWWLLVLGVLFEIGADLGAVFVPALTYLWVPELVCLLGIVLAFVRYAGETGEKH